MSPNVSTVMFAIEGGMRLYAAGKQVYVDKTLARPMPLPMPSSSSGGINHISARRWFSGETGQSVVRKNSRIAALLGRTNLKASEKGELVELYIAAFLQYEPELPDEFRFATGPRIDELQTFITIRQWSNAEASKKITALQRIAGTLVNISIDYFLEAPGALSDNKPEGRALRAFLEAIDNKDFAGTPVEYLAGDLLIAIVEAVKLEPQLIGKGDTTEKLVRNITTSLSTSASTYLKDLPTKEQRQRGEWLQLIAYSMVKGTAGTVLGNPQKILGVSKTEGVVIKAVGGTVADLLTGADDNRRLQFAKLLSGDGLETVIKATLNAVTDNPGILKIGNDGLKKVLIEVADELELIPELFTEDLYPELVRLLLEKSSANLSLIWDINENNPKKHLLVIASSELMKQLSVNHGAAKWKPDLTHAQALAVAEIAFDAVLDNPYWVKKIAGVGGAGEKPLGVAIAAILQSFAMVEGGRFNNETLLVALKVGISTGAKEIALLKKVPKAEAGDARVAITSAVDAIFNGVLDGNSNTRSQWHQARNSAISVAIAVVLEQLAQVAVEKGIKQAQILKIETSIRDWIDRDLSIESVAMEIRAELLAA